MTLFKERKRKLAIGAFMFFGMYLFVLLLVLLMLIINDFSGWIDFIKQNYAGMLSLVVSIFFLFAIVYLYYCFEDASFFDGPRKTLLIFTLFAFCLILCYLVGRFVNAYARPFALVALLCLFRLNRRQALFLNFVFAFMLFVVDMFTNNFAITVFNDEIYASLMLCFLSGTLAIFIAEHVNTRAGLLLTGVTISIPSLVIILFFKLPSIQEGWISYVAAAGFRIGGSILSAILALALLPVFEAMFNLMTVFRLRELTRTSSPLLNRLRQEAPGTFNHSLIVAQLAETCAVAIGENAELARTAAYYHDIGKLKQPDCFTENQTGYNVHDELTPELSVDIIRSHAKDGYELLTEAHMPAIIADVAREHHGTLPLKYFYDKAYKFSGGDIDIKDYSYLGPTPRSKIAAIVMIADGSEAAVRALKDRTPENVERTVRAIIEERMDLDQFANCDINQKELTIIKQTLVDALSGVHHHRVKYPSIRFNRTKEAVQEDTNE